LGPARGDDGASRSDPVNEPPGDASVARPGDETSPTGLHADSVQHGDGAGVEERFAQRQTLDFTACVDPGREVRCV
jgi:hypothetical protein